MKKTLIITFSIILLFVVISMIATKIIYDQSFPRFERHDTSINAYLRYEDLEVAYPREVVEFDSEGHNLKGYIYLQDNSHGLIVIAHGLGGGADSYLSYMKWFYDQGWSIFMYDATGSFDSEGKSTKGFPQSIVDIDHALNYIKTNESINTLDVVLFGHSWGGYAVVNALHLHDNIKAVVSIAAPSKADDFVTAQIKNMIGFFAYTQKPFVQLYQNILFKEYANLDGIKAINSYDGPVMIIQGKNDDMVTYDKTSIYAQKDEITSDNIIYKLIEDEKRSGHDNLFRSDDAIDYIEEINVTYRALFDQYDGEIPYEIKQNFYDDVDRFQVQELNESLMMDIHVFYVEALS